MTTIYFQSEPWGEISASIGGDVHLFSNEAELELFCLESYGDEFQLVEATDDNWAELQKKGAFRYED